MRIHGIFQTIEGEALFAGCTTIFIRTAFCTVRCAWCDSGFADKDLISVKYDLSPEEVVQKLKSSGWKTKYVCLTGGEPLLEQGVHNLLNMLAQEGYLTHVETSGVVSVKKVIDKLNQSARMNTFLVVDIKAPSSRHRGKNIVEEWKHLIPGKDVLKAVISDRRDYEYVRKLLIQHDVKLGVFLSPAHDGTGFPLAKELAEWIMEDNLPVRLQLQMHKIVGLA